MVPQELIEKIKLISPGTELRKALDDIINANFGALIFLVDDPKNTRISFKEDSGWTPISLRRNCTSFQKWMVR